MDNSTPPPKPRHSSFRLPPPSKPPSSPMMKYWATPPTPKAPRQGYRPGKSDGVLIAWTILCGIWYMGAFAGGSEDNGYGFAIMFVIWVIPAFWLTIIYLVARAGRRRCPVCGTHVKTGRTQCAGCGHNFAAAARS